MNFSSRILFWMFTIALGFVNPVISFLMVVLYYLPGMIQDISNNGAESDSQTERKSESYHNQAQMKVFSKDVLEESR